MEQYTKEDGEKLLRLARESIEEEFTKKKPEILKDMGGKQFKQARGVFVTLYKKTKGKKELRGCIGYPYPDYSVAEAVYKAAKQAAFSDFRFSPIRQEELNDMKIEISILTYPQECDVKDIVVGKDGLICNYLGYQGLLLPQVAVENKMNRIEFLEALCNKAGLPSKSWQNKNFKLKKFQCLVFSE